MGHEFLQNIKSSLINNVSLASDYFTLKRGVGQGDHSSYLSVVAVETLALMAGQNTAIKEITIGKDDTNSSNMPTTQQQYFHTLIPLASFLSCSVILIK